MMSRVVKIKVGAFIIKVSNTAGPELLLFTQPDSEDAPIQIPGGTVEPGESIETALWRELEEETGLTDLKLVRKIGVSHQPSIINPNEILERHCFLLSAPKTARAQWIHRVGGKGIDGGMRFAFEWKRVDPHFTLTGDLGFFLTPKDLPELYA